MNLREFPVSITFNNKRRVYGVCGVYEVFHRRNMSVNREVQSGLARIEGLTSSIHPAAVFELRSQKCHDCK